MLALAREQGLQFGTDIVFPYGPLGYLATWYYWAPAFWSRLLFCLATNMAATAGVCLLAWRLPFRWRALAILTYMATAGAIDSGLPDLAQNIALLCFGLLCLLEEGSQRRIFAFFLSLLGISGALVKFSGLMTSGLTIGTVALDFFLRRKKIDALVLASGWVFGAILGWVLLGQDVSNIATFIARGFQVASGYEQGMGLRPTAMVLMGGLLLALLTATLTVRSSTKAFETGGAHTRLRRRLMMTWLLAFLLLTWKHGFVRADSHHVVFFLGFAAVLAPLLHGLATRADPEHSVWSALTVAACLLALLALIAGPEFDPWTPLNHFQRNTVALFRPARYFETMNAQLKDERSIRHLPAIREAVGNNSVDVFGNGQAVAFLNGLNLSSRPVIQSYSAYSSPLMQLNESFYQSERAPQFVLFQLDAIDDRFAPLEDARALRHLLFNYELAAKERNFLLLKAAAQNASGNGEEKRRRNPANASRLTLLQEGDLRPGEKLDLQRFGEVKLWLEFETKPTFAGRLRQALYQPDQIQLLVWTNASGKPSHYRAPAPMLASGFIASPLLQDTEDFANALRGQPRRASSCAVEFGSIWWQDKIHFRISRMEEGAQPAARNPETHPRINSDDQDDGEVLIAGF